MLHPPKTYFITSTTLSLFHKNATYIVSFRISWYDLNLFLATLQIIVVLYFVGKVVTKFWNFGSDPVVLIWAMKYVI